MWLLLIIGVLSFLCYYFFQRTFKKMKSLDEQFPGPAGLPIIRNGFDFLQSSSEFYNWVERTMHLFQRSIRIWLFNIPYVALVSPKDAEALLNNSVHLEKANLYDALLPWLGRGLLTSYGARWKRSRKILTPAFHFRILENLSDIFYKNAAILANKLEIHANGDAFDLYKLVKLYALDNICETAMGLHIDAQKNPDSEYVQAVKDVCCIVYTRTTRPWLRPEFLFNLTSMSKVNKKALDIIHGKTRQVIDRKIEELKIRKGSKSEVKVSEIGLKEKKCFIDILLDSYEVEGNLTYSEIQEEVDTFMFEGHDTVSSAVSFAIYSLACNPQYQERAYQEQIAILGNDPDRLATANELNEMKYLEMIIKETLRLYPSVPLIGRVVTKDLRIDDRTVIPKDTQAILVITCLHRNPHVWEKPDEFYPEHFLPEAVLSRNPYSFIPFSAGPRNCIGMRFAMLELKATLSYLLRRFIFADSKIKLKLAIDVMLVSISGVNIKLYKRPQLKD